MDKYKIAHEDDHAYTVLHHDGSTFKIAKAGLRNDILNKIKKLPTIKKMAEGGVVEDDSSEGGDEETESSPSLSSNENTPNSSADPSTTIPINLEAGRTGQGFLPPFQPNSSVSITRNLELPTTPTPSGATKPTATGGLMDEYDKNMNDEASALQGSAQAKNQEGLATGKAYNDAAQANADLAASYKPKYDALEKEQADLFQGIQNGKIDPNHWWNNLSTGSKVTAGIGLILGGIGAGLTKGPNLAWETVQNNINRDIESQKQNLDNKKTLFSMNLQKYGNMRAAEAATRLQINTTLQAQISKAAAQSGSKQALSNAQFMIAQLHQQAMPFKQQLAMMQIKGQSLGAGGGEGGFPIGNEPMALLGDKEYQAKRVPVNGRAYQTNSPAEGEAMRTTEAQVGPILKLVNDLDKIGPGATNPASEDYNNAQAIRSKLKVAIPMFNGAIAGVKRINESEMDAALDQIKNPASFIQMLNGGVRNQTFFKALADEMESARRAKLIGYKGMDQYKTFTPLGK